MIVDISAQRIINFLFISNIRVSIFHLYWYVLPNKDLLTKLSGLPNIDCNVEQLYISGEFTPFYWTLNKKICANLLPSKHSYRIGYLYVNILYCIGKGFAFNVRTIILDEILNQTKVTNLQIGLLFGCLITQMILATSVPPIKDFDTIQCMNDIGR